MLFIHSCSKWRTTHIPSEGRMAQTCLMPAVPPWSSGSQTPGTPAASPGLSSLDQGVGSPAGDDLPASLWARPPTGSWWALGAGVTPASLISSLWQQLLTPILCCGLLPQFPLIVLLWFGRAVLGPCQILSSSCEPLSLELDSTSLCQLPLGPIL